jgi:hypothetical protein
MSGRITPKIGRVSWAAVMVCLSGCSRTTVTAPVSLEVAPEAIAKEKDQPSPPRRDEGEFRFPSDSTGELLSRLLSPQDAGARKERHSEQALGQTPQGVDAKVQSSMPEPGPGLVPDLVVRRQEPPLRPHLVSVEDLGTPQETVQLPVATVLPAKERARVAAADPHQPIPLPRLSIPVPERVSLDDPTREVSTELALTARPPAPVPFARAAVLDPKEHRRTLTLPAPPEPTEPVTASPQTPRR